MTAPTYEENVRRQLLEMADGCVEVRALPIILVCMSADKRGHLFWPDDLPQEFIDNLHYLLDDLREELAANPDMMKEQP